MEETQENIIPIVGDSNINAFNNEIENINSAAEVEITQITQNTQFIENAIVITEQVITSESKEEVANINHTQIENSNIENNTNNIIESTNETPAPGQDQVSSMKMKAIAMLKMKQKRSEDSVEKEDEKEVKKRAIEEEESQIIQTVPTVQTEQISEPLNEQNNSSNIPPVVNEVPMQGPNESEKEIKDKDPEKSDNQIVSEPEKEPVKSEPAEAPQTSVKTTKKISFTEAKKEIDEFTLQIEKMEAEIKDKYGINLPEFYYEDLLPDELKMKLIEDFFNSEEIVELAKRAATS
jgi:hypothetical protein